ncbi:hypothetical protein LWF01_02900 [Saxibacter everestensis]|uniref:Uncharacterized protein n=1 Tax=Saxibacter everestensis TaxID=2909229 RepID=A0ABY8QUM8_9MICO|nr:hypothetical protein LWF01_02900 [Brevibacteriaceae bacterium ZFBP1038]
MRIVTEPELGDPTRIDATCTRCALTTMIAFPVHGITDTGVLYAGDLEVCQHCWARSWLYRRRIWKAIKGRIEGMVA